MRTSLSPTSRVGASLLYTFSPHAATVFFYLELLTNGTKQAMNYVSHPETVINSFHRDFLCTKLFRRGGAQHRTPYEQLVPVCM
jgi:hypothetical protein